MTKPTMLEIYQQSFAGLIKQEGPMSFEQVWLFQELLYRMEVLQVCQMFTRSAPVTADISEMIKHYQIMESYLDNLKDERHYGVAVNEDTKKQRDTARQNLCRIITDCRKRFCSFKPSNPNHYQNEVSKTITTFLPAWLQTRNTYVKINTKETQ